MKGPLKIILVFNRTQSIIKTLTFLLSLFIYSPVFSQPLEKGLRYTSCENEYSKDILLLNDKTYLIASDLYPIASRGILIYKINSDGSIIWAKKIFGYNDSSKIINELIAKSPPTGGASPDYILGVGAWNGNIVTGDTIHGMMFLKLDANGNVLGNWSVHSVSGDICTATGIVSNYSLGSDYFIIVGSSQASTGGKGLIACIDALNAQIIWQKEVSSPGNDLSFLDIKETMPGRFVISGCVNKDSLKRGVLVEMDKNGQFLSPIKHYTYNAFGYMDFALSTILTDEKPGLNSSFAIGGTVYFPLSDCSDAYIMHLDTGLVVNWGTIYNIGCKEVITDLFYNHNTSKIVALGFQDDTLYLGYKYPYFVFSVDSAQGGLPNYIKYGFTDAGEEFGTAATYNITNDSLIMAMTSKTNPFVQCNTASTITSKSTTPDSNLVACEVIGNAIFCPNYLPIDSVLPFNIQQNLVLIPLVFQDNSPFLSVDTACKPLATNIYTTKNNNLEIIDIFPNPTSGEIEIIFSRSVNNINIKVFNVTGQKILEQTSLFGNLFNIDISNQSAGVYFIEILSDKNILRQKLIKH